MNIPLDARDIRGGECPGQLELHGGARVAAGVPDPDHRQHCPGYHHHHYSQYSHCPPRPVRLRAVHDGQGGASEGERGPGAAPLPAVPTGRLHRGHR